MLFFNLNLSLKKLDHRALISKEVFLIKVVWTIERKKKKTMTWKESNVLLVNCMLYCAPDPDWWWNESRRCIARLTYYSCHQENLLATIIMFSRRLTISHTQTIRIAISTCSTFAPKLHNFVFFFHFLFHIVFWSQKIDLTRPDLNCKPRP